MAVQYHERHNEVLKYAGEARKIVANRVGIRHTYYNKTRNGYTFKWYVGSANSEKVVKEFSLQRSKELDAIIQKAIEESGLPLKWDIYTAPRGAFTLSILIDTSK